MSINTEKIKRWKFGLLAAFAEGIVNGVIIWSLAPDTPFRASIAILAYNSGRTVQKYFSDHPLMKRFPGSLTILTFCAGLALSGCVSYRSSDGTRLTSFMQKSTFEGLRVSPKTGLSVKSAETSTDVEALRAIAEGAAAGAAKGASKAVLP